METSLVLPTSLCLQVLVKSLFTACLGGLDVSVLGLEAFVAALDCEGLLNKVLLAVLLGNATTEEFSRALDNGSDLRKLRRFRSAIVLLVVSLSIKHRAHPDKLQISLQLWCHFCLREVEPLRSSSRLVLSKVKNVSVWSKT